jgi:hypothetical protein
MRIQDQTIRFRLNRREVGELAARGRLEASLGFPGGGRLVYVLEAGSGDALEARFEDDTIGIRLPGAMVREWAAGDVVSLAANLPAGPAVLVEKDFQCLHKGEEGKDPDAYPNPAVPPPQPADR